MSLVPGLSPNIRQAPPSGPEPEETEVAPGITLTIDDDGNGDKEVRDENGRLLQINHADGAVTIAVGGGTLDTGSATSASNGSRTLWTTSPPRSCPGSPKTY